MTNLSALSHLKALKASILADGKVNLDEARQLLDFITALANKNVRFYNFKQLLSSAVQDKIVTEYESRTIAAEIDRTLVFVKKRLIAYFLTILTIVAATAAAIICL